MHILFGCHSVFLPKDLKVHSEEKKKKKRVITSHIYVVANILHTWFQQLAFMATQVCMLMLECVDMVTSYQPWLNIKPFDVHSANANEARRASSLKHIQVLVCSKKPVSCWKGRGRSPRWNGNSPISEVTYPGRRRENCTWLTGTSVSRNISSFAPESAA